MIRKLIRTFKPISFQPTRFFSDHKPSLKENFPSSTRQNDHKADDSDLDDEVALKSSRKRLNYILLISAAGIAFVYFSVHLHKKLITVPIEQRLGTTKYVGRAKIGGPFELTSTEGTPFSQANLSGKYYLIYFGFTQCPDICPVTLKKVANVVQTIKASREYRYFDLECVFVSVDPDRDSLERIKEYTSIFDSSIIGITGSSNDDVNLKSMLKTFKIHASKIRLTDADALKDKEQLEKNTGLKVHDNNYSMDHTVVTYLFGPENEFLTYLSSNLNEQEMHRTVKECILDDLAERKKQQKEMKV